MMACAAIAVLMARCEYARCGFNLRPARDELARAGDDVLICCVVSSMLTTSNHIDSTGETADHAAPL